MALVDYSDSESEPETTVKPTPAPAPKATPTTTGTKKPFQKVIDRSKPGKILVNLPHISSRDENSTADDSSGQPPAKRARTGGGGGGAFSGFNSFLPPPKNTAKPPIAGSSKNNHGKSAPRPGVNLKTGAAPGFSRELDCDNYDEVGARVDNTELKLQQQPSIPPGQKPAEEVKLVGKPMMFKPLSVSRRPAKKNASKAATGPKTAPASSVPSTTTPAARAAPATSAPPGSRASTISAKEEVPKKKVSLFSISDEPEERDEAARMTQNGTYEPLFIDGDNDASIEDAFAQYDAHYANLAAAAAAAAVPQAAETAFTAAPAQADSLEAIAADMNLSAAARRELFGRRGGPSAGGARVLSFNTDREYAHNEALRASGEQQQQVYNPLRAVAPGKHSLRQLVNQVHNQRDALEESFAQGKSNKNEAMSRYGWR